MSLVHVRAGCTDFDVSGRRSTLELLPIHSSTPLSTRGSITVTLFSLVHLGQ